MTVLGLSLQGLCWWRCGGRYDPAAMVIISFVSPARRTVNRLSSWLWPWSTLSLSSWFPSTGTSWSHNVRLAYPPAYQDAVYIDRRSTRQPTQVGRAVSDYTFSSSASTFLSLLCGGTRPAATAQGFPVSEKLLGAPLRSNHLFMCSNNCTALN